MIFFQTSATDVLTCAHTGGEKVKIPGFPPPKIPEKQIAGTYVAARVEKRSSADVKMISDLRYEA